MPRPWLLRDDENRTTGQREFEKRLFCVLRCDRRLVRLRRCRDAFLGALSLLGSSNNSLFPNFFEIFESHLKYCGVFCGDCGVSCAILAKQMDHFLLTSTLLQLDDERSVQTCSSLKNSF
jgi:hypothetical protein